MKRVFWLLILAVAFHVISPDIQALSLAPVTERILSLPSHQNSSLIWSRGLPRPQYAGSCADPGSDELVVCREAERRILSATVRIELDASFVRIDGVLYKHLYGNGHATIKDGRYLVTHNHFGNALTTFIKGGGSGDSASISIFNANSELILKAPMTLFAVVAADPETLLFDFKSENSDRPFDDLGLSSVEFKSYSSIPLWPGMEVAQVDWDGSRSQVNWVGIDVVKTEAGVPRLELSDCVMRGASGGGVFWNGHHIGNNWSRSTDCGGDNESLSRLFTVVALNTHRVLIQQ